MGEGKDSTDMRRHMLKQGISARRTLEDNKGRVEDFADGADFDQLIINGAGDKFLIGLTAGYLWRELGDAPLRVMHSRDLADSPPHMDGNTLVFFLSQSGRTSDTMAAAARAAEAGAQTAVITNLREKQPESLWFLEKRGGTVFNTHTEIYPEMSLPSTMTFHGTLSLMWHLLAELAGRDLHDHLLESADAVQELSNDPGVQQEAGDTAGALAGGGGRYVFGDGPRYGLARKLGLIMFMEGAKVNAFPLRTEEFTHSAIETLEEENPDKLPLVIFMPPEGAAFREQAEKVASFWDDYAPVHRLEPPRVSPDPTLNNLLSPQAQMVRAEWVAYREALLRGVDPGVSRLVDKVRSSGL